MVKENARSPCSEPTSLPMESRAPKATCSAGLFLNHAYRMGLLDEDDVIERAVCDSRDGGAVLIPESKSGPSDRLFDNLDLQLLSREELTELARLAEIIDLGGDVTALSTADFERVKHIVNKGRGKDITLL